MDVKVVVSIIGVCSVLVSAFVQIYLGKTSESNKKRTEIKTQAYLDLINAISSIASSHASKNFEDIRYELLKDLIQAKSRVVLVGNKEVVQEVHKFFTKHDQLKTEESMQDFSYVVISMRRDLVGIKDSDSTKIKESLFGTRKISQQATPPPTGEEA